MPDIIQQLLDLKEWSQDSARYERRMNFRAGQLVQPGPGRQGYQGESYTKDPDFIKWQKKNPPVGPHASDQFKKYERVLARKNKIVGVKQLYEALGADNPYTFDTLNNIFSRAEWKITKNMSNVEKNYIKSGQRIKKIIIDTLGEPTTLGETQKDFKYIRGGTKTSLDKVWDLNESKLKQLNKALTKNYNITGYRPSTIKTIFELADNKELMKAVDAYKGGKISDDSPILKAVLQGKKTGDISNAYMILGDIKRGKIQMEGISKDLKRGNRIIKTLGGDGMKGPLGVALLKWAKLQMAKDFNNPKATYEGLTQTIKRAFDEVGIKNIAIDEIFPARTGQLTLGKGSGVYNQIVQFIDRDINSKEKIKFDAGATKRYKAIIEARKGKNPNWARVNQLVENHKTAIDKWYADNPQAKGKVKLTQLDYNPKTHKFASPTKIYGKNVIPSKILKGMEKFHRKTGLSLDVGSTMTLEKAAADIKTNPAKFLKKMGYGKHCKASGGRVGFQEAGAVAGELTCVMDDVKKTKADMKSPDVEVRAKALTKQRKALQLANKLPAIGKILRRGLQMGTAALTAPLKALGLTAPIGYAIEGIVEGAFYDNARRKGYTHEQAFAETFTPRLAYEGFQGKSTKDVPWYGGAETLLEQELIGDPKQNPKVAQYVDALKEQDRIYDLIGKKEALKDQPTTTDETLFIPGDLDAASADVQDLARSGAYRRVDQTLKPESMAAQAYETAVERQKGRQDQRRREYLEKYDPGALKYEERTLSTPRQLEKRYEAMEEKYPTYTREQLEQALEAWGVNTPWDAGFASGVKGYDEMGEWLKTHDKYKAMEAGVANMAGGGIAGIRRPWAIPPSSGPMPQGGGLSSQFNRVKKLTG